MKLDKEEIQKIILGALMFFGVVYSYFNLLLGPLQKRGEAYQASVTALGPEIANAKAQIKKTRELEAAAPGRMATTHQVEAMIPEGSPVAWFPPRVTDFFKKQGLDKASTKLNSETVDKDMVGFRRMFWGIDLPKVGFVPFATAVAALENEEPLVEINNLQLDASREDIEMQHALITVSNIVKQ
jgi:hypothetical protein